MWVCSACRHGDHADCKGAVGGDTCGCDHTPQRVSKHRALTDEQVLAASASALREQYRLLRDHHVAETGALAQRLRGLNPLAVGKAHKLMERFGYTVGCGDNSCIFGSPGGMATNGGCRCWPRGASAANITDQELHDCRRLLRDVVAVLSAIGVEADQLTVAEARAFARQLLRAADKAEREVRRRWPKKVATVALMPAGNHLFRVGRAKPLVYHNGILTPYRVVEGWLLRNRVTHVWDEQHLQTRTKFLRYWRDQP